VTASRLPGGKGSLNIMLVREFCPPYSLRLTHLWRTHSCVQRSHSRGRFRIGTETSLDKPRKRAQCRLVFQLRQSRMQASIRLSTRQARVLAP